jgi:DNA-binding transcriptional ArsR family regulator
MPQIRLVLSGEDLRKVRLLPSADPVEEMTIAAHRLPLLSADPALGGWARRTVSSLGPAGVPLLEVMNSAFVQVSDLTQTQPNSGRSFEEALETILAAPRAKWRSEIEYLAGVGIPAGPVAGMADGDTASIEHFGTALRRFHDTALAPYWPAVTTYSQAGRDDLMRLLADRGIDELLNGLHPTVTWRQPVLTMDFQTTCPPGCVHQMISRSVAPTGILQAGGRGLLLLPSVFAASPTFRVPDPDEDEPFVLTFPVAADWRAFAGPTTASTSRPLADLLGSTRALVMGALAERELTTSDLARTAHISTASASEHTSVLRAANLVESTRVGNRVIHRLTVLGAVLVRSASGQPMSRPGIELSTAASGPMP